ncbi:MAG: cache domain-containing protein, partial [Rhodobacterales bacterium]
MSQTNTMPKSTNKWNRLKLGIKVPIMIAVPTILISVAAAAFSYVDGARVLKEQNAKALEVVLDQAAEDLVAWFDGIDTDMDVLSSSMSTEAALRGFSSAWATMGSDPGATLRQLYVDANPNPDGEKALLDNAGDGSDWSGVHATYHDTLHRFAVYNGYSDLLLLNPEGDVVYSAGKEPDFATNFVTGPYKDSGLAQAFVAARDGDGDTVYRSIFAAYAPDDGLVTTFFATRISDAAGAFMGVVAVQVPLETMSSNLSKSVLLGETGHVYLVDAKGRALSFVGRDRTFSPLDQLPGLEQIQDALADEHKVLMNVPGVLGKPVEALTVGVTVGVSHWGVVLEQDMTEVLAAQNNLALVSLIQVAIVCVIVLLLAIFIARSITQRISRLAKSVD